MQWKKNIALITKLILLALTIGVVAARLSAEVVQTAEAVAQAICADASGAKHPKRLVIDQPVTTDLLGDVDEMRLVVGYDPEDGPTNFRGKLITVVTRYSAGSMRQRLGKVTSRQNTSEGSSIGENQVMGSLTPGDMLRWTIKMKKFQKLEAGQCVVLIAGFAPPEYECGPYPAVGSSGYVLPYEVGRSMVISQGNCSVIGSHRGAAQHAYDFAMPLGTPVIAARAGRVLAVDDSHPDDPTLGGDDNVVRVEHEDGTLATYAHVMQGGAQVNVGEQISQGQVIALSGNSGSTDGVPHLHFQVTTCTDRSVCGTEPIAFANAGARRLEVGKAYRAR